MNLNMLDLKGKETEKITILGHEVVIAKVVLAHYNTYYNAYVELKGSSALDKDALGNSTFKEGDVWGVDTAHYHNERMTLEQKKDDAIRQITEVIEQFQKEYDYARGVTNE